MLKKSLVTVLIVLASLAALLVLAYQFRPGVIRTVANTFLDDDTAVLGNLQGVELGLRRATVGELELLLPASGLRVVIRDIGLDYSPGELLLEGRAERLAIASIALNQAQPATTVPEQKAEATTLLSDLLLLFREFPVNSLDIADIRIPGRTDALTVNLRRQDAEFSFSIVSGALQLLATLHQQPGAQRLAAQQALDQQASSSAALQLNLTAGSTVVADFMLDLQPAAAGYQLSGTGHADIADFQALLGSALLELLNLPLAALQLDFTLQTEIADAFLVTPPALFSVDIERGSRVGLAGNLIEGLGPLMVTVDQAATLTLATGSTASGSGQLPLSIAGSWQQQPFAAALVLDATDCRLQQGAGCAVSFDGSADLAALTVAAPATQNAATATALIANAISVGGSGTVSLDSDTLLVTLNPATSLSTGSVVASTLEIGSASLTASMPLQIGVRLDGSGGLTLEGEHVTGTLTQLVASGYSVDTGFSLRDMRMIGGAVPAAEVLLQTQGLQIRGAAWLPPVDVDASLQLQADRLTFSTPLLFPAAPTDAGITVQGRYELDSGDAAVQVTIPALQFEGPGVSLSSYLQGWPFPFDVMTGTFGAKLDLEWTAADEAGRVAMANDASNATSSGVLTGSVAATLQDAAGYYEEMFFAGLDTQLDARIDTAAALPITTPPLALQMATLDVGVPLTDLSVNYQVDGAARTVDIAAFRARLLGGSLSGEDVRYELGSERNFVNLRFSGLRLDRMLELAEYDGIEVSGAVSGMLPLAITATGVEVEAGTLFAEAPGGSIRYLDGPTAGSGGNLGVDLVNQALGNYQFESLQSSIDYSPDGELLLAMQMQGHNPDMNNGQRINLNLNLSDNIPTLLNSLQAGRAIEQFLEEQYGPAQEAP